MSLTERVLKKFIDVLEENDSMLKALQDISFVAQSEIRFEIKDLEAENQEEEYFYKTMYYLLQKKMDVATNIAENPIIGKRRVVLKQIAFQHMNSDAQKFFEKI